MMTGGRMATALYEAADPFCVARLPDDTRYTLDHFYAKLFSLPATMRTAAGRAEAERRASYMRAYLEQLHTEIALPG
mgnify:CR=1 FL=1